MPTSKKTQSDVPHSMQTLLVDCICGQRGPETCIISGRSIWHQGKENYPVPLIQVSSSLQAEALLRRPEQDIAGAPQQDRQYRQRHRQERLYWRALDQEQAEHDDLECQGRKVYLPGNLLPNLDATGTCQSGSHSRPTCHGQVTQSGDESLGKMQGYLKNGQV